MFRTLFLFLFLAVGLLSGAAYADVWKWVDAEGNTHFVDTLKPIYTWVDDNGKRHYSDTPEHRDAVSIELVWVSAGTLEATASEAEGDGYAFPGETAEERAEREQAEAYFCKRATEVYASYLTAPQLYKTGPDGKKVYLSEAEAKATIEDTRQKKEAYCR